jgi:amino acid adenylation domain-containing protein
MNHLFGAMAGCQLQQAIRAKCFHPAGTFVEFKKEEVAQSIPDRFEQMVASYPDRIAVQTRCHTLTYDSLNKAANRLARAVLEQHQDGEKPITLLLENDAPMIAAIIGVLKAGRTYIPLDPLLPFNRNSFIVKDSGADLVVTNSENSCLANTLFSNRKQLIIFDKLDSGLSAENPSLSLTPETPAYILYTSGSTGQPKGVVQSHRNVLHFVLRHTNSVHLSSHDRQTLLYSPNVNGAARDIFSALLNGASLFPLDIKKEGLVHLAEWLIRQEITIYCSVATVFRHFVGMLSEERKFPKLRLIKLGGEPVYKSDVEMYQKHFSPDCILCSGLGSTETGTTATEYFVDKNSQVIGSTLPIGYAAAEMEILLLDDKRMKVESDNVGEIAVKSHYLFSEYWRRPDLTEAAFLPGPKEEERVYLTGDLGRMRADGCLEHAGRKDFQMKVRGHRIEAAEIEMALRRIDTLKDAVVVARQDEAGDKQLVAYLVSAGKQISNITTIRNILAETLPDFMIPSLFVTLDALPVGPNGKVDRRALPAPDEARPDLARAFVAPRNPVEEALAEIWAEFLKLDTVGVHDNFFDLGGHSLLATQIVSKVLTTLQVELPVRSFFDVPTVAGLSKLLETIRWTRQGQQGSIESKDEREEGDL